MWSPSARPFSIEASARWSRGTVRRSCNRSYSSTAVEVWRSASARRYRERDRFAAFSTSARRPARWPSPPAAQRHQHRPQAAGAPEAGQESTRWPRSTPLSQARRRKRGVGWFLVVVGAFFALQEFSEGGPITHFVPLATIRCRRRPDRLWLVLHRQERERRER